jgi:hypothetical protein
VGGVMFALNKTFGLLHIKMCKIVKVFFGVRHADCACTQIVLRAANLMESAEEIS